MNDREEMPCLTLEGKKWLTTALDPFHDTNVDLMGLPDANGSSSFVVALQQTQNFSAPSTATSAWNCHISFTSLTHLVQMQYANYSSIVVGAVDADRPQYNTNGSPLGMGPILVSSHLTGNTSWFSNQAGTSSEGFGEQTASPCRIIGMAFEVVDVTPKLYQQGSVTVYSAPAYTSDNMLYNLYDGTNTTGTVSDVCSSGADSQATAQLLRGSKTWAASEGAYCVGRIANFDMGSSNAGANFLAISDNSIVQEAVTGGVGYWPGNIFYSSIAGNENSFAPGGAIFTGLNYPYGTLQVTTRIIYEYFPRATGLAPTDAYLPLSSPSAPYDACAFQAYSKALMQLPPGVPVAMNGVGDWFRMVLNAVDKSGLVNVVSPLAGRMTSALNSYVNRPTTRNVLPRSGVALTTPPTPRVRTRVRRPKTKKNKVVRMRLVPSRRALTR